MPAWRITFKFHKRENGVQITFWGVRGSYPAPGAETLHYGGNTPCIEVQAGSSRIIVDAGTGIYALGRQLEAAPAHHHILFSHVHWDHIQGLPFFAPLYHPAARLTIHATPRFLSLLKELFTHDSRHIHLPIPSGRLQAQVDFQAFQVGETWELGELEISAVKLNHPYLCVGFCFRANGRSAAFYSDTAPFSDILFGYEYRPRPPRPDEKLDPYEREQLAEMRQAVIESSKHADLLIYDAHFTPEEYPRFAHFGHSTPTHALEIALEAQVKRLVLFHHAPTRSDAAIAQMEAHYRALAAEQGIELSAAREGERITL